MRLGESAKGIERRVQSGSYASATEVVRAALRALDREEQALEDILRQKVVAALDDPRPSIPADQVFASLRAEHEKRVNAAKPGA